MKLDSASYIWALRHLSEEGDSDLFPAPFEIQVFDYCWPDIQAALSKLDVEQYQWSDGRRFVIPKEALAFRNATQLDPFDSLVLAALIYEFGSAIESHRIPAGEAIVFSRRFDPKVDGRIYGDSSNWDAFWSASLKRSSLPGVEYVAVADREFEKLGMRRLKLLPHRKGDLKGAPLDNANAGPVIGLVEAPNGATDHALVPGPVIFV